MLTDAEKKQRKREALQRWRKANPDKEKARRMTPQAKEAAIRRGRKYRERMGKSLAERQRVRYANDPEYRRRMLEAYRRHWHRNKDERVKKNKQYLATHPEKVKAYARKAYRKTRDTLTDGYVRGTLSANSPLPATAWPQELVDLQRANLKLKRATRKGTQT